MKKIINTAIIMLCMVGLFASCDSDRESNPTLVSPDEFVLNTPTYSTSTIDLATSAQLNFTWQYPEYAFPVSVNYVLQYSPTGNFTKQFDNSILAEDQTVDFANGDSIYNDIRGAVTGGELAKKIQQVMKNEEGAVPATQDVSVRAMAYVGTDTIYSNVVKIKVIPYYVNLTPALPQIWGMTGATVADGSWANPGVFGTSWLPMYTVPGATYDLNTGEGPLTYTGYFGVGGFKIVGIPGYWDDHVYCGIKDTPLGMTYRKPGDADPGDITVAEAGYYTITIDTKAMTGKMVAAEKDDYKVYTGIFVAGNFNGWDTAATPMTPVSTIEGIINHDWTCTVTFTDTPGAFKFTDGTDGGAWWGGTVFPYGTGTATGGDIPAQPGTYTVVFNDITGSYIFILQE